MQVTVNQVDEKNLLIEVDGQEWRKVRKSLYSRKIGSVKSCQTVAELEEIEQKIAYNLSCKLLGYRSLSKKELLSKLKQRLISEKAALHSIKRLESMGYIDEDSLAIALINSLIRKGKGPKVIAIELQKRLGLTESESLIYQHFPQEVQVERIVEIIEKRQITRESAYVYFYRRGFDSEVIGVAINGAYGI